MAMSGHSISFAIFLLLCGYLSHYLGSLISRSDVDLGLHLVGLVCLNQFLFGQIMNSSKVHGFLIKDNVLVCTTFEVVIEIKKLNRDSFRIPT